MKMKKFSLLVLLDFTAAFDSVDYSLLLDRLHNLKLGLSGADFNWFKSYLSKREFYVTMNVYQKVVRWTAGSPKVQHGALS